jgi:hypothetical protein
MIKRILLIATIVCGFIFGSFAQTTEDQNGEKTPHGLFKDWAVGLEVGTYGPGITVATSLSPNFKLRAGLDYFKVTSTVDFDISPDGFLESNANGTEYPLEGSLFDPQIKFVNFKAIVDYYPRKNGIFSVSAGFYLGNSELSLSGKINDYSHWLSTTGGTVVFDYEGSVIKPKNDGSFEGKLKFGNVIKPYFGLGLGRTIANSRLAFKFDLGLIYQGDLKFESDNVSTASGINKTTSSFADDADIPSFVTKIWPVLNFSLSYRIF